MAAIQIQIIYTHNSSVAYPCAITSAPCDDAYNDSMVPLEGTGNCERDMVRSGDDISMNINEAIPPYGCSRAFKEFM
ncbi:Uncharacterized protein TCM_029958 [Theobroma cacao]|uniref:Uncharacterized protein n=1 Tax=Theobroma cacao TaxID=3641 RepID=A0A061GGT4_THECC|nr:Uncharacterized protein TCM_029958 [Theobroma cacao]